MREKLLDYQKKKPGLTLLKGVLVLVTLSLAVNLTKQFLLYNRLEHNLAAKKEALLQLEEKNQVLKARLEEVQKPYFSQNEVNKLLGEEGWGKVTPTVVPVKPETSLSSEVQLPNYRRWWQLFFY